MARGSGLQINPSGATVGSLIVPQHFENPTPGAFVGRERELEQLRERLAAGERLLTVTGPGGMGKTRLASELAAGLADGALSLPARWFCDLTEARAADELTATVAHALEVPTGRGESLPEKLGHALSARGPALLVLDNFEQLVRVGGGLVSGWLRAAPELRILVTSRERLRLAEEVVFELGPLELPAPGKRAEDAASVRLLLERASRHRAGWSPTSAEAPILGELVAKLDGIPLAIELAAARLPMLGARTLSERLSERFRVLGTGARDGADKSRTLRATIDWSWQLLDEAERRALTQASIFRGGFDLDAAEAVLDASKSSDRDTSVLERLESLYDKSLLRAEPGRFGLYLSIRDFAEGERPDDEHVRARHARWYVDEAAKRLPALGEDALEARRWLLRERENLAAVVDGAPDPADALRAALSLEPLLSAQGPFEELTALLDRALARDGAPEVLRAEALLARGNVHRQAGRTDAARTDLEAARACADANGRDDLSARALAGMATVDLVQGNLEDARAGYERALTLHRAAGDRVHEAMTLSAYGAALAGGGDLEGAREVEERALALHHEVGNLRDVGMTSAFLGNIAIDHGRLDEARLYFADAAAIHDQLGDRFGQAFTEANLAIVDHRQDAWESAIGRYDEALRIFEALGARRYAGAFIGYRALARMESGDREGARRGHERACELLAAAGDDRFEAFFRAHLATVLLAEGDAAAAERELDAARDKIEASGDPFLRLAVELLHVPSWRATGTPEDEARIADVLARAESSADGPSPVSQSADVLFAFRRARAALGEDRPSTPGRWPRDTLVVHPEATWMCPPGGARVELGRRDALRRLLDTLSRARLDHPGRAISREALIAAAWPGERILKKAAQNRLRVGIATLRKLGLANVIVTDPDGYLLDAGTPLSVWADAPEGAA